MLNNRLYDKDFKQYVKGFMIESFIEEGNQKEDVVYGKSITDPCLGWADTERLILDIAEKVSTEAGTRERVRYLGPAGSCSSRAAKLTAP